MEGVEKNHPIFRGEILTIEAHDARFLSYRRGRLGEDVPGFREIRIRAVGGQTTNLYTNETRPRLGSLLKIPHIRPKAGHIKCVFLRLKVPSGFNDRI